MLIAVRSIGVKARPDQVWDYLRTPRNVVEWWPNCEELCDEQPHSEGGFVFRWTSRTGRVSCREEIEETVSEPGEGITLYIAGDISGEVHWRVRRQDEGTHITFQSAYDLPMWAWIPHMSPLRLLRFEQYEADRIAARVREHFDGPENKPLRLRAPVGQISRQVIAR